MKNELGMKKHGRSIGGEEGELSPLHARKKVLSYFCGPRLGTYHEQKKYDKKFRRFCGSHYSVSLVSGVSIEFLEMETFLRFHALVDLLAAGTPRKKGRVVFCPAYLFVEGGL